MDEIGQLKMTSCNMRDNPHLDYMVLKHCPAGKILSGLCGYPE